MYLALNHAWHALRRRLGHDLDRSTRWGRALGRLATFLAVVAGWVVFRSDSMHTALAMLRGMSGAHGFTLPDAWAASWGALGAWLIAHDITFHDSHGLVPAGLINWIVILLAVVWLAPNTQQIMERASPALGIPREAGLRGWLLWRPGVGLAVAVSALLVVSVVNLHQRSEFLYFQF